MGRPREHTDETREHLLHVAGRIIRSSGPDALTVRGLAAEAGVTTRAIYSLFSGLPELVAVLCDRASEAMARHHEAVPVTDNPLGEIVPLALAYRAAALEQADLYDLIFAPPSAQTPASEYPAGIQRSVGRVEDSIRRAIAVGQLAPVEDRVHFRGLWALVHGLTSLELRGALGLPKECEGIWRDAVSTYVRGIAPGLPREA